jgi:DNA-binding CsgD family transcriptional regulator
VSEVKTAFAISLLDAVSTSRSFDEFCKQLIQKSLRNYDAIGSVVFLVNLEGHINHIGASGIWQIGQDKPLHTSSKSIISDCVRKDSPSRYVSKSTLLANNPKENFEILGAESYLFLTLSNNPLTLGLLVIGFLSEKVSQFLDSEEQILICRATESFLSRMNPITPRTSDTRIPSSLPKHEETPTVLTSRQMSIIALMAQGFTNSQIGRQLHLSESSIKQESVRIFRFLGVDNRRDAVEVSNSMNLV